MRKYLFLLLLLIPLLANSQNSSFKSFLKLSSPEKKWAVCHAFTAMKAWRITLRCRFVTDSLQKLGIPDRDPLGGKLDAFRHSFWMATLTGKIGVRKALSLGRAHEKGNYRDFKHRRLEEGDIPDKTATDMDLFNNNIGSKIGVALMGLPEQVIMDSVMVDIAKGKMVIILKDALGRSCDSLFKPIPDNIFPRKWITGRVLVSSNGSCRSVNSKN